MNLEDDIDRAIRMAEIRCWQPDQLLSALEKIWEQPPEYIDAIFYRISSDRPSFEPTSLIMAIHKLIQAAENLKYKNEYY